MSIADLKSERVCLASSPEWLTERARCVTGSDIPAIMGKSKWTTREQILKEKLGGAKRLVNRSMWWGSEMEVPNMTAFGRLTGLTVTPSNEFYRRGIMGATIDGYVGCPLGIPVDCWEDTYEVLGEELSARKTRGLIEMKNCNQFALKEWQRGCPEYYELQAQAQMFVTAIDHCVVVAKIGAADMLSHVVEADRLLHEEMYSAAEAFWAQVTLSLEAL